MTTFYVRNCKALKHCLELSSVYSYKYQWIGILSYTETVAAISRIFDKSSIHKNPDFV